MEPDSGARARAYRAYVLCLLITVGIVGWVDRNVLAVLLQAIKQDFALSDTELGLLSGVAFGVFYATVGLPVAWLADRYSRSSLIAVALGLWSVMTAACGLAGGFASLFLARIGVGIGEAGGSPPSQSLIADYFPPSQRARAFGVLYLYIPCGFVVGYLSGGWLNDLVGWRLTFLIVGLPGVLLALVVRFTLLEPPRGHAEGARASETVPPLATTLRYFLKCPALRHLPLAGAMHGTGAFAAAVWLPSYFIRTFGVTSTTAGTWMAIAYGCGGTIGVLFGGQMADAIVRRTNDPRWYAWGSAAAVIATLPCALALYLSDNRIVVVTALIAATLFGHMFLGPVTALVQNLAGVRRRATAAAFYLLLVNLVSMGLGPAAVGIASDFFGPRFPDAALRYALLAVVATTTVLAATHFVLAARTLRRDLESLKRRPPMSRIDRLSLGLRAKLPVLLQTEAAECGVACLAMIASYHGHRVDVATLRRRFAVSAKGTTLASLIDFAARLELATRAIRLEIGDLDRLRLPCILHWRFTHFVVLERVGKRGVRIHDPGSGAREVPLTDVAMSFTGIALELWPNPRFERRRPGPRVRLRDLIGTVDGARGAVLQVLLLAAALEAFVLANPLFLQWVIDHVLLTANRDLLVLLACGFGIVMLFEKATAALRGAVIMHFETLLNVQWHANVFAHLLRLPLPYFEKRHLGDIVSRFRSIDAVQRTVTTAFIEAIVDGGMTLVLFALMCRYSATLAWICAGATGLYALGRQLTYRPLRAAAEEQIANAARQESHFIETVRGLRAVKLFERHQERRDAWIALLVEQVNAGVRAQKIHILLRFGNGVLFGSENIVVVLVGALAILDGRFSVGMLIAFVSYQRQFSTRVGALIDKSFELKLLRLHAERLADIVLTEPEADAGTGERLLVSSPQPTAATIEVRGLRFRYAEHEAYVLDGVDLKVAAGESVAIVGASGCGKSTLVHLLLGVLPATAGEVLIGGARVCPDSRDSTRRLIASVTQNDTLFAGSIADNISFFDADADQQRIEECARLASVHAEIAALPMAYNTFVGYLGALLSAGQQQRILLARALYRRPAILILDEATSHLDVKREIVVSSAIRALRVTRLIVAHRPQTVATADRIVTLDGGRIVRDAPIAPGAAALRRVRLDAGTDGAPNPATTDLR